MPEYTLFEAQVTALTPLHIGTGRDLLQDYDYTVRGGRTWRLDEDALLDAQNVDDPAVAEQLARTPPAQLLGPDDYQEGKAWFAYVLPGTPRSRQAGAQLREQIKDPWQHPYLPGSSLKGALRTALVWHGMGAMRLRPEVRYLGRSARWAAQELERRIMGKNPNYDLLRALHVSDSAPVGAERLMLVNAQVLTHGGASAPIEVEAVRPETAFRLTVKRDDALWSDWAKALGLRERAGWLRELTTVARAHAGQRIAAEEAWYAQTPDAVEALNFYRQLARLNLPEGAFLVQIGWGGGWESKTLGSRLREDEGFMEHILGTYRMARGRRQRGDPFPKSRRTAMRPGNRPSLPLGWALVQMQPRDGAVEAHEPAPVPLREPVPVEETTPAPTPEPVALAAEPIDTSQQEPIPPAPVSTPPEPSPSLPLGPGTGVVIAYNFNEGAGTVRPDGSDLEVSVSRAQLARGTRYLAAQARVSFVVVPHGEGVRLQEVQPLAGS